MPPRFGPPAPTPRPPGADLVLFPELFLAGYPPEDLVLKPAFQEACRAALRGAGARDGGRRPGGAGRPALGRGRQALQRLSRCSTAAASTAVRFKVDLPNYGVFDEKRVFEPGPMPGPIVLRGRAHRRADLRGHLDAKRSSSASPKPGGEILLVPNGSPYWRDKNDIALSIAVGARRRERPAARLSQPGRRAGRTGLRRRLLRAQRRSLARRPDAGLPARRSRSPRWRREAGGWRCDDGEPRRSWEEGDEADYAACVLGLRDYVDKNRFPGVVLGLSGGIDSALCAAMAVDALGAERVHCIMLPYRYTSQDSLDGCRRPAPRRSASATTSCRSAPAVEASGRRCLAPLFEGRAARHHRREPAEPRARHDPDGDLQQVRPDGGDHRQQVGDVGGLRHALRRHERRLQPDQGPLQDGGLPPVRLAQPLEARLARWGRTARSSPRTSSPRRRRPNCARTRRTRIRCRPTRCSTTSSKCLVEKENARRRDRRARP